MKVLVCSPKPERIASALLYCGDSFDVTTDVLDASIASRYDYLVSYAYRHIIKPDVLNEMAGRNCNLHISLLPWNRGSDPNFWSWIDKTPKGVTIHEMDRGLDTGPIYCQQRLELNDNGTLRTTYDELSQAIERLFFLSWPLLRMSAITPTAQRSKGSYHRSSDKTALFDMLPEGHDTTIAHLLMQRENASRPSLSDRSIPL